METIKSTINRIFELEHEKSPQQQKPPKINRYEYLDGYRGSLAIVVAISHIINHPSCEIFNATLAYSSTYAVAGFFMLSAFLLTHRLLDEFDRLDSNKWQPILLILSKYTIRRFFRIYLVYVVFIIAIKFGPSFLTSHELLTYEASFWQMVTLGNAGRNHLWTIPVEIRYYFFIPIFCLGVHFLRQYKSTILGLAITWTIYDQLFNFFHLTIDEIKFEHENIHRLYPHFAVFFLGTQVALAFHVITRNEVLMGYVRRERVQIGLDAVSLMISLWGLKKNWWLLYENSDFAYRSRATLFWSIALLLTLLGENPNTIGGFFGTSRVLKSIGKYSFSFYLLHMSIGAGLRKLPLQDQLSLVALGLTITYFVSFLTFYLVENPLIRVANCLCVKLEKRFRPLVDDLVNNNNNNNTNESLYVKLSV